MATRPSWRRWVRNQSVYSPQLEDAKAIGQALESFENSLLAQATSIWSVRVNRTTRQLCEEEIDDAKLVTVLEENLRDDPLYAFFFINRFLVKPNQTTSTGQVHKLCISPESFQLLTSACCMVPTFLFALSRYYFPNGRDGRCHEDTDGHKFWTQWYFLPVRVQVPCSDKQTSHTTSTTGSNQMNPFHYLHLPDQDVDIRGSHIALHVSHNGRLSTTTAVCFNFMDGRWPKLVEEPQFRITEALKHPHASRDPMFVHLVFLTTAIRWWNNALHSVNEQLITYEKRLQEDVDEESSTNSFYNDISKFLHAVAAHVHRYETELDSLENTSTELAGLCAFVRDGHSASSAGLDQVRSQLKAANAFAREQEKKIKNLLDLLFNRMQITNDRRMVAILRATQEEAAYSRQIAQRSQELAEDMKKDSVSMKTIAIMTLFFLPATSFAAIFAMPFFTSNNYLSESTTVWVWVVFTVPTTAIAYAFYRFWSTRESKTDSRRCKDREMNRSESNDDIPVSSHQST